MSARPGSTRRRGGVKLIISILYTPEGYQVRGTFLSESALILAFLRLHAIARKRTPAILPSSPSVGNVDKSTAAR